jgi:small-conductance mechanosensitive channel
LLQNQIVNYSGFHYLATAVEISVGYERDKNEVIKLLVEAASNIHGTVSDNPKPYVSLKRFDSFAAVYELRAYTDRHNDYLKIESDIRENIYELFQRKGIDLGTPNILHMSNTNNASNQTPM